MSSLPRRDIPAKHVRRRARSPRCGLAIAAAIAGGSCLPPAPPQPPSDADNATRSVQLLQSLPGVQQATLISGARQSMVVVTLRTNVTEQTRAELRAVYEAFFAAPSDRPAPSTPTPLFPDGLRRDASGAVAPALVFVQAPARERRVWGIPVTDQARSGVMRFVALACAVIGGLALALAWVTRPRLTPRVVTAGYRRALHRAQLARRRR